ncbi:MAG: hypothetical protein B6D64_08210 [Bacteroidetes bacterium 4484_276]|nr:MAG: hypothetical protein B6D64_08210 [Bacteroidetes bacterium 4484_276]
MKTGKPFIILFFFLSQIVSAQFPPAAGQAGTTAIHKDSSVFVAWATGCDVIRGPIDIMDFNGEKASYGEVSNALGIAEGNSVDVVSLGDMGQATLTFDVDIADGEGWDFAVFENALNDTFLELAFVLVSSDGENFYEFPAVSLTDQFVQIPTFGELNCTKINNFAGKYRQGYGTPFDLAEVIGGQGLDLQKITHIKITDAIGCIQNQFASFDSEGHVVNDPWPTPFETGGFDLDAVGVINTSNTGIKENEISVLVFPNPFVDRFTIRFHKPENAVLEIFSAEGQLIFVKEITGKADVGFSDHTPGIYLIKIQYDDEVFLKRVVKSR